MALINLSLNFRVPVGRTHYKDGNNKRAIHYRQLKFCLVIKTFLEL